MELVEKHFNAVTFGNELKPDALFNYQLDSSIKTKKINFNDSELEVPVVNDAGDSLDFSRADAMADKILEWNKVHPELRDYEPQTGVVYFQCVWSLFWKSCKRKV